MGIHGPASVAVIAHAVPGQIPDLPPALSLVVADPRGHLAARPVILRTGLGRGDDPPRAVFFDVKRAHVIIMR